MIFSERKLYHVGFIILYISFLLLLEALQIDIDYLLGFVGIFSVVSIIYHNPNFFIRYIMLFFMALGNLIGVFICEHSKIWLTELNIQSGWSGSFPLLLLGWSIFILIVWNLDKKYLLKRQEKMENFVKFKIGHWNSSLQKIIICFLFIVSLILFLQVMLHPAFLEHMDRFRYRSIYIYGASERLSGWLSMGIPILLLGSVNRKYNSVRACSIITLLTYSGYLLFTGEKFGGFFLIIVDYCIIYSIYGQNVDVMKLRAKFFKICCACLVLMLVLVSHMVIVYDTNGGNIILNYLPQRIAQQGQLWWRTYQLDKNNGMRINELHDETETFFQLSDQSEKKYNHAIYKIMRFTTPNEIVKKKINGGSRYSTSTYASMYYYFKNVGVIAYSIIGGVLFWFLMHRFMIALNRMQIPEIFIFTKFLGIAYGVMAMSEFNLLFQFKIVMYIIFILGLAVLRECINRRNNNEVRE